MKKVVSSIGLMAILLLGSLSQVFAQLQGNPKWICPLPNATAADGSPALDSSGRLFITAEDGKLYGIFPSSIPANKIISPNWALDLQNIGGRVLPSPSIDTSGFIYVHTINPQLFNGKFPNSLCAITNDGTFKWITPLNPLSDQDTSASTPAIDNNGVIYTTGDDAFLFAVDSAGDILWSNAVVVDTGNPEIDCSPVIGQNCLVYVWASDDQFRSYLYGTNTGSTLRQVQINLGDNSAADMAFSPVPASDGTIYIPNSTTRFLGQLLAINPNNTTKWTFNLPSSDQYHIQSSPIIGPGGIVYFGSTGGFVYALNPTTGAMIWHYQTPNGGGIYTSPAISSDGTLYVTSTDGHLYAINASNGQLVWQYPEANSSALGSINSSPVIGSDGTIYFGSADGNVYAVTNGVSGTTLASSDCPMFRNNPAHTGMLNSSDTCPLGGPGVTCFSQISAGPLTDSSFTLRCFAKPLSIWGVYKSSDQVTWTQIGSVTMGANGSAQFVDTTVTGVSTRYYKICNATCCSNIASFNRCNGMISTVAGNRNAAGGSGDGGSPLLAGLSDPLGIAFDGHNDLYIADMGDSAVRVVAGVGTPSASISSPAFLPPGISQIGEFISPCGVLVDPATDVYVADADWGMLREFTSWPQSPAFLMGCSPALSVSRDIFGNLICIDEYGNTVSSRTPYPNNNPTIIAGNGIQGYGGDNGPATQAYLSVSTWNFLPSGKVIFPSTTIDGQGNIYIADMGNNVIRKVDHITQIITTVAGTSQQGFSGDGGPAVQARLNQPAAVAVDAQGNLYIADTGNNRIRKVDASGNITTVVGAGMPGYYGDGGSPTSALLYAPAGLTFDSSGNLYISDTGNNVIRKVSFSCSPPVACATVSAGTLTTSSFTLNCTAAPNSSWTVYKSSDQTTWTTLGNITMNNFGSHQYVDGPVSGVSARYYKICSGTCCSGVTGFNRPIITTYAGQSGGLSAPVGLFFDPNYGGYLFVADLGAETIKQIAPGGTISSPFAGVFYFSSPVGVALDANGYMYVADADYACILNFQDWGSPPVLSGPARLREHV